MKFFSYDSPFFRVMSKLADIFIVSLLWLVFSLPLLTIGASTSALYYAVRKSILRERGYVFRSFLQQFKDHFRDSFICSMILEGLFLFLIYDVRFVKDMMQNVQDSRLGILYYFFYLTGFLVFLWALHVFTYRATFEMGWKGSLKNGGIFFISTPLQSIIMLAAVVFAIIVVRDMPFMIFLLPALLAFLWNLLMEKVYRRTMNPDHYSGL